MYLDASYACYLPILLSRSLASGPFSSSPACGIVTMYTRGLLHWRLRYPDLFNAIISLLLLGFVPPFFCAQRMCSCPLYQPSTRRPRQAITRISFKAQRMAYRRNSWWLPHIADNLQPIFLRLLNSTPLRLRAFIASIKLSARSIFLFWDIFEASLIAQPVLHRFG
ncbi:hypothetical protein B0H19DRAFT_525816 [Mycena capillaripes]|nr:hypothetical protein B0H19DRAFT_525816 [Mycena capillaripes]